MQSLSEINNQNSDDDITHDWNPRSHVTRLLRNCLELTARSIKGHNVSHGDAAQPRPSSWRDYSSNIQETLRWSRGGGGGYHGGWRVGAGEESRTAVTVV